MNAFLIGVIVLAIVLAGWLIWQQQRTQRLRARYGSEYDRTIAELGRLRGETELVHRQQRVQQLDIRALTVAERERFVAAWRVVQEEFVDDPEGAVTRGNALVDEVMHARGYPVADFDRRVADLSVDHPRVVQNYRVARDTARKHAQRSASTEALRQAMVLYRELFEDLLETRSPGDPPLEREVRTPVERADELQSVRAQRRKDLDREVRP